MFMDDIIVGIAFSSRIVGRDDYGGMKRTQWLWQRHKLNVMLNSELLMKQNCTKYLLALLSDHHKNI